MSALSRSGDRFLHVSRPLVRKRVARLQTCPDGKRRMVSKDELVPVRKGITYDVGRNKAKRERRAQRFGGGK